MCNAFGNRIAYRTYVETFNQLRIPLVFDPPAPNLEPREMIRPTDRSPVIRASADGGFTLGPLRWGFPPTRPRTGPLINFRSEGRAFGVGRCLAPASHFFEYTGTRSPKTRWRFTVTGEDWFCFAAVWRRCAGPDGPLDAFTLLTCVPGPDVEPLHDRQPVLLDRSQWRAWLDASIPSADLIRPSPAGFLTVARDG